MCSTCASRASTTRASRASRVRVLRCCRPSSPCESGPSGIASSGATSSISGTPGAAGFKSGFEKWLRRRFGGIRGVARGVVEGMVLRRRRAVAPGGVRGRDRALRVAARDGPTAFVRPRPARRLPRPGRGPPARSPAGSDRRGDGGASAAAAPGHRPRAYRALLRLDFLAPLKRITSRPRLMSPTYTTSLCTSAPHAVVPSAM